MNIFRSEPMEYMQFVFPRDAAYLSMRELGSAGIVHFTDLNPNVNNSKREFAGEVRRCNELRRSLRFFATQLEKAGITPDETIPDQEINSNDLQIQFEEFENDLKHLVQSEDEIKKHEIELIEMKYVLQIGASFFDKTYQEANATIDSISSPQPPQLSDPLQPKTLDVKLTTGALTYLAGIISFAKLDMFHRMIFVALRGNVLFQYAAVPEDLMDATTRVKETKYVFVVFFSGEYSRNQIMRICSSFNASLYPYPTSTAEHQQQLAQIEDRLRQMENVQSHSSAQKQARLLEIKSQFASWSRFIAREKAIFHTLNMFSCDEFAKCLIGEGWVESRHVPSVNNRLVTASRVAQSQVASVANVVPTAKGPPTHIRTTKFTKAVQEMTNAFGTADYREVNPGLFAVFSFPILFAMMFGDLAHGLLVALFGLACVLLEKRLAKMKMDLIEYMYVGRYLILCMGLMGAFVGLLYNETFSLSINFFGSQYKCEEVIKEAGEHVMQCAAIKGRRTYPFGVDPVWRQSSNFLLYTNSIKMKMAIIVGVLHMLLGIFLSLFNFINKGNVLDIVCKFIPEVLLMLSLFGYLSFLIIFKWLAPNDGAHAKPMLIRTMINMFLSIGKTIPPEERLFEGQETVQLLLVLLAVVCLVWLLVPKPIIIIIRHYRQQKLEGGGIGSSASQKGFTPVATTDSTLTHAPSKSLANADFDNYFAASTPAQSTSSSSSTAASSTPASPGQLDYPLNQSVPTRVSPAPTHPAHPPGAGEEEEVEEFSAGEVIVHQIIDTIEYALGCVSNTASYLRLWALSLAHGELAEVFFNYFILVLAKMVPVLGMALGMAGWIAATVGILLMMEGLSAFLHCLRLHWVEFQNKFYKATGYPFQPLSFKEIDQEASTSTQPEAMGPMVGRKNMDD